MTEFGEIVITVRDGRMPVVLVHDACGQWSMVIGQLLTYATVCRYQIRNCVFSVIIMVG